MLQKTHAKPPAYRHFKPRNLAVVRIDGKDHYLGEFNSPQSWEKYHRLLAERYATDAPVAAERSVKELATEFRIKELCLRFINHAETYYQKNGRPTSELVGIRQSLKRLLRLYAELPASEFSPIKLKLVRDEFLRDGNCRSVANQNVSRIRRMFRWAVEQELVSATVFQALMAVTGLKKGRCAAREAAPVTAVTEAELNATLPHLSPILQSMVRIQWLTGMRPGEICQMRPQDIDRSRDIWCYRPEAHKTIHHGDERRVYLGPQAQILLAPYLDRAPDKCCFSPVEAQTQQRAAKHAARKTPPMYGNRPGTNRRKKPQRTPGERYSPTSYRRALERACEKAKIEPWSPNQLRHARATELRRLYGLDAAQVVLGHQEAKITQVYAERDFKRAEELMRLSG